MHLDPLSKMVSSLLGGPHTFAHTLIRKPGSHAHDTLASPVSPSEPTDSCQSQRDRPPWLFDSCGAALGMIQISVSVCKAASACWHSFAMLCPCRVSCSFALVSRSGSQPLIAYGFRAECVMHYSGALLFRYLLCAWGATRCLLQTSREHPKPGASVVSEAGQRRRRGVDPVFPFKSLVARSRPVL